LGDRAADVRAHAEYVVAEIERASARRRSDDARET